MDGGYRVRTDVYFQFNIYFQKHIWLKLMYLHDVLKVYIHY